MTTNQRVGTLYTEHHNWLFGWLRRRLGCPDNAADLAQDTFIRLLSARSPLHLTEARALLMTIAKGLVVDHYRRSALEQAYLEALARLPEALAPSPETRLIVLETLIELDRLLDGLPPKVRQAFLWSQIDGLGYAEIAERLQVSLSSVQQYMTRALRACYAVAYGDD